MFARVLVVALVAAMPGKGGVGGGRPRHSPRPRDRTRRRLRLAGAGGGKPASKPTPVPAKPSSCTPWTCTIFAGKPPAGLKPKPGTSLISQLALGELPTAPAGGTGRTTAPATASRRCLGGGPRPARNWPPRRLLAGHGSGALAATRQRPADRPAHRRPGDLVRGDTHCPGVGDRVDPRVVGHGHPSAGVHPGRYRVWNRSAMRPVGLVHVEAERLCVDSGRALDPEVHRRRLRLCGHGDTGVASVVDRYRWHGRHPGPIETSAPLRLAVQRDPDGRGQGLNPRRGHRTSRLVESR